MITLDFSGRNAIVTGAGSGIAKAIALQLAEAGACVWIGDVAETNALETLEFMKPYGKSYGFSKTDVGNKDDVSRLFQHAIAQFGTVDIVVNGAGVFMAQHFLDAGPEQIKKHLDINLMGIVYGCQLAVETMIRQGCGGKIVNISSVGGRRGDMDFPFYALGKAGILNLTQSVALLGAPHRINCNAVCPGIIRTPMWDTILKGIAGEAGGTDYDALFDDILKTRTPLGRAQTADEIAHTVLFLCSRYTDQVTGQAWNVCGGSAMN